MSYLGSLLSSIGDNAPPKPAASAQPAPQNASKRKADEELNTDPAKRPTTPSNPLNGLAKRPATPSSGANGVSAKPKPSAPTSAVPYAGAARPVGAPPIKKEPAIKKELKPQASSTAPLTVKTGVKAAPSAAKPSTPTADKPAPKKGSYADIIARAKAAQQSKGPSGVIMHKQGEKVDRKILAKEATKDKNGLLKDKKLVDRSRTSSAEVSSRGGDKTKQKPKPIERSDYKGSAKPTTPTYAGSARPNQAKKPPPRRYDGYAGTDEEIDDHDEEDDYDDDSDDMEAGAFDVEDEEREALRAAKRDDAMELALENRLKAEKMAKKNQLAELAASRKKKKEGY